MKAFAPEMMRDGFTTPSTSNATLSGMEAVLETQTDLFSGLLAKKPAFRLTVSQFVNSHWTQGLAEVNFNDGSMTIKQEFVPTLLMVDVMETKIGLSHKKLAKTHATTKSRS